MKTGSEWFNLLTKKQQKEYRVNLDAQHIATFDEQTERTYPGMRNFLESSFIFMDSPQKDDYWYNIIDKHES